MTKLEKNKYAIIPRSEWTGKMYYDFCKEILCYEQMEEQPHLELCNFLMETKKNKKLVLLPRGAFKSSVVTCGYSLWSIVNDPNIRIGVYSKNHETAKRYSIEMKTHIEQNEVFKAHYGDLKPSQGTWSETSFTVNNRTKIRKEPSVICSSLFTSKVGQHYDLIILDDCVDHINVQTPLSIQRVLEGYRMMLSILDPGGMIIVIGTRYSHDDLYSHIQKEEASQFDILVRAAINSKGELYFPTRLTMDFLKEQKKTQGSYIFSSQYLNNPVNHDEAIFKKQWFKYYDKLPNNLNTFLTVDPAATTGIESDYSAFIVTGVDSNNNIFVIEAIQQKLTVGDCIKKIFELMDQYKCQTLGLETTAFQATLKYTLAQEMNIRKQWFGIVEAISNNQNSKHKRIRGLQPQFENGKIWLKKEHTELLDQLCRFPLIKHDDLLDALAQQLDVIYPSDISDDDTKKQIEKVEKERVSTAGEVMIAKELEKLGRKVRRTRWGQI